MEKISDATVIIVAQRISTILHAEQIIVLDDGKIAGMGTHEELMKNCDFAVTAGGTTLYELCAVGVPTVVYSMADNQVEFVKAFDKAGAAKYVGDIREEEKIVQKIVSWGIAAIEDQNFRKKMSDKARKLVGGGGANKIAHAILEII